MPDLCNSCDETNKTSPRANMMLILMKVAHKSGKVAKYEVKVRDPGGEHLKFRD